jgi:hypothetical protein
MKKISILLFLVLLAFGQTVWAQNSQTVYLTDANPVQSLTVDETVEIVWVYASFPGMPDPNTGQFELTVPQGCIMKLSGEITSGQAGISWDGGSSGGYSTDFSGYWAYASQVGIQVSSSPGEYVDMIIEVSIYNPDAIREEEVLRRFINYTEVSDLGVVADITLSDYLTIGQDNTRVVTIDLNGHILQRNLTNATGNGCVIVMAQTGNLTLTDGTVGGGWNNSTTGNTAGGIVNKGTLTLNNVTIDNCKGDDGGGINNANGATLTIAGGTISNCLSKRGGGGIVNKGTATLTNCTMDSNTATTRGGAIWNNSSLTVSSSTMSSNQALAAGEGGDGGAIHLDGGTANLSDVTITNNTSKDAGGIYVKSDATLTITGTSIISNNTSSEHGGGGIVSYGTAFITGCAFSGNSCKTNGGGIWTHNSLSLTNCTFSNNHANGSESKGGALFLDEANFYSATLTNCTFTGNYVMEGGAIYVSPNIRLYVNGGTIIRNMSFKSGGGITNQGALYLEGNLQVKDNQLANIGGGIANYGDLYLDGDLQINGNSAYNNGGGIVNYGTLTILDGDLQINGNSASNDGGGIANIGLLRIVGGNSQINGNSTYNNGGGIANYGILDIKGNLQVKDNTSDDIYLPRDNKINVTGCITSSPNSIGINMEIPGVFTDGYSDFGSCSTNMPFFAYSVNGVKVLNEGEFSGECAWVYGYVECSWDEATQTVIHTPKLLTESFQNLCDSTFANGGNIPKGWYIVEGTADFSNSTFECAAEGNGQNDVVHIILCDNSSITMNRLSVNKPNYKPARTLNIYCQSYGEKMGKLTSINTLNNYSAAIGGLQGNISGIINIHGGDIHAEVNCTSHDNQSDGAGIGSAYRFGGQKITIYDGKIYAKGGLGASGIGGGSQTANDVTIHGGDVTAKGGLGGAGIGSGQSQLLFYNRLHILITGGTINATGGGAHTSKHYPAGAGIGTGGKTTGVDSSNEKDIFITISGGKVTAQGGLGEHSTVDGNSHYPAAGIGTGGEALYMKSVHLGITISGGEVFAHGGSFIGSAKKDGAGIGGGYGSPGGDVVISGGKVTAIAGHDGASAIGAGDQCESNGTLNLPDDYSVRAGASLGQLSLSPSAQRVNKCLQQFYAIIEPCEHSSGTWSANNTDLVCSACPHCLSGSDVHKPYTFQTSGTWNTASNWFHGFMPQHQDAQVALKAAATIPHDYTVHVDNIDIHEGGSLTLEDSAQVIHNNEGVVATVEKNITAYSSLGGYYLIANPVAEDQAPSTLGMLGMLDNNSDLYGFDQSQELEWRNYKQQFFNLENGIGYIYANITDIDIAFNGVLNRANANISVPVTYDANAVLKGLNLVGNPFACNAYLLDEDNETIPFFKMNEAGNALVAAQAGTAIKPCEGVFIICPNDGQAHSVIFTTTAPANLGVAQEVPSMLLPVHTLPVHQDASSNYIIQTIALLQGWNWWSPHLNMTLDDLKATLVAALPDETSITIKSQTESTFFNGSIWRGTLETMDVAQMYEIKVPASCTITLTGAPIDPSEHPVTIAANGNTWIGYPFGESKTLSEAFGSFPVNGDIVKSKDGSASYNGTMWRGVLTGLQPGQGYIYKSASGEERTFTFPVGNR